MNRLHRFVTLGWHRAVKLRALLAEPRYRRALRHGVAASVEHDRTPLRHDYGTIIDVGANRGQFALVAAQRFPQAALICFEPQAEPRSTLERVMSAHPRLRILDAALAACAGTSVFHITRENDSSSLLRSTALQVSTFPGSQVIDEVTVDTQPLSALLEGDDLERPVLLKIDVQGSELDVLTGATALLDRIDTIVVECSFVELYSGQALADDVIAFLHRHSFRLADLVAPTAAADGRVLQADLVFERMRRNATR